MTRPARLSLAGLVRLPAYLLLYGLNAPLLALVWVASRLASARVA